MFPSLAGSDWWLRLGWTMLHCLWVGSLLGLGAWTCKWGLRSASAGVRYLVAICWLAVLAAAPVAIAIRIDAPQVRGSSLPQPATRAPEHAALGTGWGPPSISPEPSGEARPASTSAWERLVSVLPWIWLVGAPLTLAWSMVGLAGAERLRRLSRPANQSSTGELCRRLARSVGLARGVSVRLCERIALPVLVGIVRPVILLPPSLLSGLAPEQLEMLLLHELAHVRRWDNLVNFLQRVVESLLFFHPAVWAVSRWVRQEREHCCDELVIARMGDRAAYAETLLSVIQQGRTAGRSGALIAAVAGAATSPAVRHNVQFRIYRILGREDEAMQVSRKLGVAVPIVALAAMVLTGVFGLTSTRGEPAQPPLQAAQSESPKEDPDRQEKKEEGRLTYTYIGPFTCVVQGQWSRPQERKTHPVAQGIIRWVNQHLHTVWINLGRRDGLETGTEFEVYKPGKEGAPLQHKKGVVVIRRVLGDHLAEGAIVEYVESPILQGDLILPGDFVFSHEWRPSKQPKPDAAGRIQDYEEELARLLAELATLRAELENVLGQQVILRERADSLARQLQTLESKRDKLGDELDRLKSEPVEQQLVEAGTPPPAPEGVILAVSENHLVEVSLGSDDGLRKGQRLDVYRSQEPSKLCVGRIEVVRTQPDTSVCHIISKLELTPMEKGDRVTTRLRPGTARPPTTKTVHLDAEGQITMDQKPFTVEELAGVFSDVAAKSSRVDLVIAAHPKVKHERMVEVITACTKAGVGTVRLMAVSEEDIDPGPPAAESPPLPSEEPED